MPILTYVIESTTRTNALTSIIVSAKKVIPAIDGNPLIHHFVFDGTTTDVAAKAAVKLDLEIAKGYGTLTEG